MKVGTSQYIALVACFAMLLSSCQSPTTSSDHLRFHEWWNFYERAMLYMEQKDYQAANHDLKACLGLAPGARYPYAKDVWKERTYGLHTIDNYFPHRELGVCYYYDHDYSNAVDYLKQSLDQEPSGRARYYLNLARAELLAPLSFPAPIIDINKDTFPSWTSQRTLSISGITKGKAFIKSISINNQPTFIELAKQQQPYKKTIPLQAGKNIITISATDLKDQTREQMVTCMADWAPPQIVIAQTTPDTNGYRITGSCYDNEALQSVVLNHDRKTLNTHTREYPISTCIAKGEPLYIEAIDKAGNTISMTLDTDNLISRRGLDRCIKVTSSSPDIPLSGNPTPTDQIPPILRLRNPASTITVYDDEYFVEGEVIDRGGITSITINGEEWLRKQDVGIEQRKFAGYLPIASTSRFDVIVQDSAGNKTSKSFTVIQQTPGYLNEDVRLRAALPPVYQRTDIDWIDHDQINEFMMEQLLKPPVRFNMLARGEAWDHLMTELNLSNSDIVNPKAALKLKRLLPAEYLFLGNMYKDPENGVTVFVQIVDVEKGHVLFTEDIYAEPSLCDVRFKMGGLISKIEQRFPVLMSTIHSLERHYATINVGDNEGCREGIKFVALETNPANPSLQAGQILYMDDLLLELVTIQTQEDSSTAKIIPKEGSKLLRKGDYIYTR